MPYNRKTRDLDAGPIGRLRLADRQIQEARNVAQPPSATGGAPRQTPGDQMAAAVGESIETPTAGVPTSAVPNMQSSAYAEPQRWNQPLQTPDVLTGINVRAQEEFDRWVRADPDLVQATINWVDDTPAMKEVMDRMGIPKEELAERLFTYLRGVIEPRPEALPMDQIVRPSLFSRRLLHQLQRWRMARSTFQVPPPEGS